MKATLAIINAKIITMDVANPTAEAIAIQDGKIIAIGRNSEIRDLCTKTTRIIDAQQKTVLPGMIDSHYHLVRGALRLINIDLSNVQNFDELLKTLRTQSINDSWIVGTALSYSIIPDSNLTRHYLDQIESKRPIILYSSDRHIAWVNTLALKMAGILKGGQTNAGSQIVMSADGLASGELREREAYAAVENLIPTIDKSKKLELIQKALKLAAKNGITTIHNMDGDYEQLELLELLEKANKLSLQVLLPIRLTPHSSEVEIKEYAEVKQSLNSAYIKTGLVKFLIDGVIEGKTALLNEPYADQSDYTGSSNFTKERFFELADIADKLNLQIATHAIGDGAVRLALDTFQGLAKNNGLINKRHRIEHIELLSHEDLKRFKKLNVIAAMQPYHCPIKLPASFTDDAWYSGIGKSRLDQCFLWRSILNSGATLVFGSDWPVVSNNPFLGIKHAVLREPWSADVPNQALTLLEALWAYTGAGAYAEFAELNKGLLRHGCQADLIVLDKDITATEAEQLESCTPVYTICLGQIVYEKNAL